MLSRHNIGKLESHKGLTIIEVLIASTVFMIGFTVMVFLLGQIVTKHSAKNRTIAFNIATSCMEKSLAAHEFSDTTYVDIRSNISYRVLKNVEKNSSLIKIRIRVLREKQDTELINLYSEKYVKEN